MAGAKFSASFSANYYADVKLSTTKIYTGVMAPIVGSPSNINGAYVSHWVNPKPSYTYSDPQVEKDGLKANPFRLKVSPLVEAGVRLRVPSSSGRVGMRLGIYAEWALPIQSNTIQGANLIVYDYLESFKDNLYSRAVEYVLIIPEGFEKNLSESLKFELNANIEERF